MTYKEAVKLLQKNGIEDPAFDAAELFCRFVGATKSSLLADSDKDYPSPELLEAIKKRADRIPLQYILGEWEFFGLTFEVSEACLCPRADTEVTVEEVLKRLPKNSRILELCTGSGCIPIALCHTRPDIKAISTDLFDDTLAIAKRNAELNGVADRIKFVRSDIFSDSLTDADESFDAVVSNPPYIPTDDLEALSPEVHREPRAALDGGTDGLDFYREILSHYKKYLKPDGFIALEIGYDQAEDIVALAAENSFDCTIIKDLGGNDRCAVCKMKKSIGNR